jgi:hypothetical protein
MKPSISTYSRMYLVTPTVYEKLLTCIDEKDKKITQDLNASKDKKLRASDDYIQGLNIESFNEPREEVIETGGNDEEFDMDENPPQSESTDVIYQSNAPEKEGFTQVDNDQPIETNPSNVLSSPCVTSESGEVIPRGGLIYRPMQKTFKAVKEPVISIPRLSKEEIDFYTKPKEIQHKKLILKQPIISIPKLTESQIGPPQQTAPKFSLKKPILSIPRLEQQQIDAYTNKPVLSIPRLQQSEIDAFTKNPSINSKKTKVIVPQIKKHQTTKIKNFQCTVCLKFWRSKWDLKRHMSTVHSNIKSTEPTAQALPDTDDTMEDRSNDFPIWRATRSQKRSSAEAKLPTLKNNKFRPPGGEDDDFEQWK